MKRRGFALLSTLALTVILMMMIAVLLKRSETGLFRSAHYRDGIRATQAARGGLNHLVALLEESSSYAGDQQISLQNASYAFTFDDSQRYFCVNNLDNAAAAPRLSALGHVVAPHTADLMVVGSSGHRTQVVHAVVQRGLSASAGASAVGRIRLYGDVEVSGIKTIIPRPGEADPDPAPGGLQSKYRSPASSDPAIGWDGAGTFSLSALSRLEAAPTFPGG